MKKTIFIIFPPQFSHTILCIESEQPAHIFGFYVGCRGQPQFRQQGFVAESDRVLLLYIAAPHSAHGLQNLLLCHVGQIFPQKCVTELVIGAIDVVAGGNDQIQVLLVGQLFHDFHVPYFTAIWH